MNEKKILLIIVFNVIIIICEVVFGFISNSFALIADALHNTGDVLAVIITYIALKLGSKKFSYKFTFGYIRAEMMAAFVNTLFLYITMFVMIYVAIERFFNPLVIEPLYMITVGFIAFIANGISAYILNGMGVSSCSSHDHSDEATQAETHGHKHVHHHEDANIKSAYLHMLSDALISLGVVIAGIFIYFYEIYYIDSVLTIVFSVYILFHSYSLLKKSFLSLMDVNTTNIKEEDLDKLILCHENIEEYHDLHIIKPSSKYSFISFHLVLKNKELSLEEVEKINNKIRAKLKNLGFNHILIQSDTLSCKDNEKNCYLNT